jgi:hypothetical protein
MDDAVAEARAALSEISAIVSGVEELDAPNSGD